MTTTITNSLVKEASSLMLLEPSFSSHLATTTRREGATATEEKKYPLVRLILVASGWIGIQMIWALEYALTTPFFTQRLHIDYAVNGLIWSAGPITGLLVQPIVGSFSDTCTSRWGRRRPFILAGVVLTVVSSFFFSFAERIGGRSSHAATAVAIVSFWMMDVSINMVMGPFRALLSDLASHDQQSLAQTLASLFQSCGQIIGFFIPSAFPSPLYDIEVIFLIAYVSMAVTVTVSCCFAKEAPRGGGACEDPTAAAAGSLPSLAGGKDGGDPDDARDIEPKTDPKKRKPRSPLLRHVLGGFKNMWVGIKTMSLTMLPVVLTQTMTWFAWFCYMPYATDWFGQTVFQGARGSSRYDQGVAAGSRASAYQAVVQLVFSLCCPFLLKAFSLKWTYALCLADMATCLFIAGFIRERHVATLVVARLGIALAATNIFPFAIVGRLYQDPSKKGLVMGMLNVFIVIPQLLDTAYTGSVVKNLGPQYIMLFGACWAVLATLMVIFFIRTKSATPIGDAADPNAKPSVTDLPVDQKSNEKAIPSMV